MTGEERFVAGALRLLQPAPVSVQDRMDGIEEMFLGLTQAAIEERKAGRVPGRKRLRRQLARERDQNRAKRLGGSRRVT